MGETQMFVVYTRTLRGETKTVVSTTTEGHQGGKVLATVKAGTAFWAWMTNPIPPGQKIASASFDGAPVCASTADAVQQQIDAITVEPEDVLTFEPI